MLVNNVNGERRASTIVKDSGFYIEIAKFVQAYTTIVRNPNEFLTEIGETAINEETDRLNWQQFVKIVQSCDLGFENVPSATDLVVFYNYALDIGSLDHLERRLATVDDVANAQKHYYNFVDEATDKAQADYLKQHKLAVNREREVDNVDSKLTLLKTGNIFSFIFMLVGVFLLAVGVSGFFFNSVFVRIFGNLFHTAGSQYIGAAIYCIVGLVIFVVADKFFVSTKDKFYKLQVASTLIFNKADDVLRVEQVLKHKLDKLKKDLTTVQSELADKTKKFDVKHNIERLKKTNKYYKKLCVNEEENAYSGDGYEQNAAGRDTDDSAEFAPVKLTREQEENLHTVSKAAIGLEGVIDEEAYNEKFEKSEKSESKERKEEKEEEKKQETAENEKQNEQNLDESLDYLKNILGIEEDEYERENY